MNCNLGKSPSRFPWALGLLKTQHRETNQVCFSSLFFLKVLLILKEKLNFNQSPFFQQVVKKQQAFQEGNLSHHVSLSVTFKLAVTQRKNLSSLISLIYASFLMNNIIAFIKKCSFRKKLKDLTKKLFLKTYFKKSSYSILKYLCKTEI